MPTNLNNEVVWPPAYTLKKHPRAKHIKLKASVQKGLEIVVPPRFNVKQLDKILLENKTWIENKLAEIRQQTVFPLPEEIVFPALNLRWKVSYCQTTSKRIMLLTRFDQELVLVGDINNQPLCKKILINWVKAQAKQHLKIILDQHSRITQLPYSNFIVRSQRTRWGSCSTSGTISLNFKLLFLPSHLLNHIILHELCHLKHLNHSSRFWRLLGNFDPEWRQNNKEVRKADKLIPLWL